MSVPNKSLDKNKRYAGVKANDFVNKTRANEANRSVVRPQGWANLGKINNRRIPPPANLPSLKSEVGVNSPTFDPIIAINHGWTSNESPTPISSAPNPTQQQLDSLPVNSPTPPPQQPSSADADKSRIPPTWSTITAGTNINPPEPAPNLLGLNDFPRLATTQDRKPQPESLANPTFRPTNLAIWKEGGGSRVQPLSNDIPHMVPTNPGANFYQQQVPNVRMYPPQMWAYNPYPPVPSSMHQPQRFNTFNEYKSPTILRNKDIDDLSKITDNTWANASQEVNYEEKIRFSDDEDENNHNHNHNRREILESNNKPRRMKPQILQHPRLIQDDEHLKQMQENKNSELINALTIAKQRRDEQERHLRHEHLSSNIDEQKQIPGYQTRPLLTSNEQENYNSAPSLWQTNKDSSNTSRTRHDTANSQSSFTMKSWSDQMDSFNYASLHEKSGGRLENDDPSALHQYSRSQSGSSSQSQRDKESVAQKSKKLPLSSKKQPKSSLIQTKTSAKKSVKLDSTDYYDNSNDQWDNWDESPDVHQQQYANDNQRRRQQLHSDDLSIQKSNRYNKQPAIKTRNNDRQQTNSRFKSNSASINKTNSTNDNKSTNNKTQPVWRPLSPHRPSESIDSIPQESTSYKPQQQINDRRQSDSYHQQQQQQQQRPNLNDHKQRYQTINTASIPPLMSVRSDASTTAKLYKTANHTNTPHYDDENAYYDSNLQTNQRYHQSNMHNRGYTTLGSYGRYRRGGTLRHQQQYTTYNTNNTSGGSSTPQTSSGTRQKKNATNRPNTNNKKMNSASEPTKPLVVDEANPSSEKQKTTVDEIPITKPVDTSVLSPTIEVSTKEIKTPNDSGNGISEPKTSTKTENETSVGPTEKEPIKSTKKTATATSANPKRRTNKDQQNYHQDQRYQNQQAPRHRNNYAQSMQDYEAMQMTNTHNYYGTARRTAHSARNHHMHDLSSNYYYEHPQQHYNSRYNYSNEHYQQQQQQQQRPTYKQSKRGGGVGTSTTNNRQPKQPIVNGSTSNNNNNNLRHHSTSDNDQKEGEEWETASESSTNMRNGHYDTGGINNQQTNDTKSVNRGRTPPKKSFSSQRPNARQIFKYTNA